MGDHSDIDHTGLPGVGAGGGGFVWLERQTASASAQLDLGSISSTYDTYKVEGTLAPANNAVNLLLRFGTGGGPTIDTGTNYYGILRSTTGTSGGAAKSNTDAAATSSMIAKAISNAAVTYGHVGFSLTFRNLPGTTFMKQVDGTVMWHDGSEFFSATYAGAYAASPVAITALRFYMSAGNITWGQIDIYGLAKS